MKNPFAVTDVDRHAIWEMLVERDIAAFCIHDWQMIAGDFQEVGFFGLHARGKDNPDQWLLDFPSLVSYRNEWLRQAAETAKTEFAEPLSVAILRVHQWKKLTWAMALLWRLCKKPSLDMRYMRNIQPPTP